MSDNTAGDLPTPGKTRSRDIDVFVSYARSDNRPFSPGAEGWVSAVVRLLEEAAIEAESPMRIFFDTQEIESGDYWEQKLRDALRSSRVLVAFVSPAYFRSSFCRWEWEQHLLRRERLAAEYGGDGDVESPAQTILFVEVPEELGPNNEGGGDATEGEWRRSVLATHFEDFAEWYAAGPPEVVADGMW